MPGILSYLTSFFVRKVHQRINTAHNDYLEVVYDSGKMILNSRNVNYSFGGLHEAFANTFQELNIRDWPFRTGLVLGLGAGSVPSLLADHPAKPRLTGVEIDGDVLGLARAYFELDGYDFLTVVEADAISFVQECGDAFDLIIVDLFIDETVPPAAETRAFLEGLKRLLAPDGLLLFNRISINDATKTATERFGLTFAAVFPDARVFHTLVNLIYLVDHRKPTP